MCDTFRKCHECLGKIQVAGGVNKPCPCACHKAQIKREPNGENARHN
jgi:hypothetical protein